MTRSVKRRLSHLEDSLPIPVTPERFVARAHRLAKRTRTKVESAMAAIAQDLSDSELDSLTAEFERIVFGSDTAARDAEKSKVLAAAGYPDWTNENQRQETDHQC